MSTEDIKDKIRNGRLLSADMVSQVEKDLKDKKDEKMKKELAHRLIKGEEMEGRKLLALKKAREEEDIKKKSLTAANSAVEKFKTGKSTPEDYDKELAKINEDEEKAMRELRSEYSELEDQLYKQTQEAYRGW